jgi:hypothetical protein
VERYGLNLEYVPKELQNEHKIVLAAVHQNGFALKDASSACQANPRVVLVAVRQSGRALRYASSDLRDNVKVVLEAVSQDGSALKFASPNLQANVDIVMAAVRKNWRALRYASSNLQDDRDVVTAAVLQHKGLAMKYASPELRANEDMVLFAIGVSPVAFKFAADKLKNDHGFVARATRHAPNPLTARVPTVVQFAAPDVKKDVLATVKRFDTFGEAKRFLQSGLQSHAAFMEFLCIVTSKSAHAADHPATKVNLDKVTSEKLHRNIAEYIGVPLGQQLHPVRLVKRVFPIMEAFFQGQNNLEDQDLAWLRMELPLPEISAWLGMELPLPEISGIVA